MSDAPTTAFLMFLGFPEDVELSKRDPRSKRKPNRSIVASERPYNGVHPSTRGWRPGEPRKLTTESRHNRSTGKVDVIFDAPTEAVNLLADFGPDSSGFAHLPEKKRSSFGFVEVDPAKFKRARAAWDRKVADERAEYAA